ncbi:MAG: valine--tRNA ligase, partial [Chitinophagaceae bacterium]
CLPLPSQNKEKVMELSKNYNFRESEDKWYKHWTESGFFNSTPDEREPYTVVIPPPNVTGILHMGHCLNNTIQDILVRRARMQGKNACWVPGTDHASIATEAKVVQMLRERGIQKASLSREEFLKYAWEWKEKYGGIILIQLKKLGCSIDWNRTSFTMDPDYYQSVIFVFNDLYKKGYIYRGKRMINWDPRAKTALSDEEVIFKEIQSKLYFLKYPLENADGTASATESITIATVRPETILGDTAIAVNPKDERYQHLIGKYVLVPLINRRIKIIADDYVTVDFGTGALKITPAHDMNDYQLGQKHGLGVIDILNDDGTLSAAAQLYVGLDRFEARKQIVPELENKGYLVRIEDYTNQVGFSERTDVVVEPRLSLQWWVDMKKIYGPALKAVADDEIKFYPAKYKNLYRHWMENIKDWCISRQLWWGHRIPAWFDSEGRFVVAMNEAEAKEKFIKEFGVKDITLTQDEDCLDTWFSSWLWPFEVFHGISNPGNKEVQYYYPTNTLVTAPEIIFFWVARMIMAGYEYMGQKPFNEVYFTGIVRDKQGRKMSKQLGNSPDLLEMIDEIGADAVRFGILISSPAGNDLLWDKSSNEQGRNFINKLWNALKLVELWKAREIVLVDMDQAAHAEMNWPNQWFRARLYQVRGEVNQLITQFRLSEALKTIYSLIWDDFCSWYLEWIKPGFEEPMSSNHLSSAIEFFEELMELLHPFMPFVTEEIYQNLRERATGDNLCIVRLKTDETFTDLLSGKGDTAFLQEGNLLKDAISGIRDARNKAQIKPKEPIKLFCQSTEKTTYTTIAGILSRQVNAEIFNFTDSPIDNSIPLVINKDRFYILAQTQQDTGNQAAEMEKELEYLKGFLLSVDKKLSNERFIQNAKTEVIEMERKKKADAEIKIQTLLESLTNIR